MKKRRLNRIISVTLTAAMLASAAVVTSPMTAEAVDVMGVKPEDGTTVDQPFESGTGGSRNFRIPCMVTLDNGTVVTACDARWNHGGDACGLDTIVSYSTDNGKNWNYTFANYLGDYGNNYHAMSTAFIDPALATDGETVYMIADLWPGGYAINTAPSAPPVGEIGFNEDGKLRLSADDRTSYAYYLDEAAEEDSSKYVIKAEADDVVVEGYAVDAFYNVTWTEDGKEKSSNLFFDDAPYKVYPTDYLYFTKSTDGGKTWSEPDLLNLKLPSEQTLLVGPGRGIAVDMGEKGTRLMFTAYDFTYTDKNSLVFYSDDNGETWQRGGAVSSYSSESVVTQVGTRLYIFTRHGGYYISDDYGETWSEKKAMGITYWDNCQLTAITYSQKIDGKDAILFAAPSSTSGRYDGKIFVGLVQEDGTIDWAYEYKVNDNGATYAYSCITELNNGDIALLYENGGTSIYYDTYTLDEVLGKEKYITLEIGETYTETAEGTTLPVISKEPDETVAEFKAVGEKQESVVTLYAHANSKNTIAEAFNKEKDVNATLSNAEFTITLKEGSENVYHVKNESAGNYLAAVGGSFFTNSATDLTITPVTENGETKFTISPSDNRYAILYKTNMYFDMAVGTKENYVNQLTLLEKKETVSDTDVVPGYQKATAITSGKQYLIAATFTEEDAEKILILYPGSSGSARTKLIGEVTDVYTNSLVITGVGKGTTEAVVDGVEYYVTVKTAAIPTSEYTVTDGNHYTGDPSQGAGSLAIDGNSSTMWHTNWYPADNAGYDDHWITIELSGVAMVDGYRYVPRAGGGNGNITKYRIETSLDGTTWETAAEGTWKATTMTKEVEFEAREAKYVRLTSLEATSHSDKLQFSSAGEIRVLGTLEKTVIPHSVMKATAGSVQTGYEESSAEGPASFAIDDDANTKWHTVYTGVSSYDDLWLQVEFTDSAYMVDSFRYLPRQAQTNGTISKYKILTSMDGVEWTEAASGEWTVDAEEKVVTFEPVKARYVRLKAEEAASNQANNVFACAAEINMTGNAYACDHTDKETKVIGAVAATCTTDGYTGDTICADCGGLVTKGETITAAHSYGDFVSQKDATCTEAGMKAHYQCSECKAYFTEDKTATTETALVIPAKGHDWSEWEVVEAATTEKEGLQKRHCLTTGCDAEETEIIKKVISFSDVQNETSFYYSPVYWAAQNGLTTGKADGSFDPKGNVTRGEMVTFLWRLAGSPDVSVESLKFTDVGANSFYAKAIAWAVSNGIATGTSETTFEPKIEVNRAQAVTFLWRYAGAQTAAGGKEFKDVPSTKFFYQAVAWASANGVTTGDTSGNFTPYESCNRGSAVTFIYRTNSLLNK